MSTPQQSPTTPTTPTTPATPTAAIATAAQEIAPNGADGTDGTDAQRPPRGYSLVLGGMILAIVLICAYWLIWFGIDRDILASSHASAYYTFENAFPLADGWLALALLLAVIGLLRRRSWGLLATLLAGGAGIYLGCMDVLFDLENHIYTIQPGGDASGPIIEMCINALTFLLGIVIIAWVWRNRSWLLDSPQP